MTRILVIDGHLLFREGLCLLLNSRTGTEVIGEASTGCEGVHLVRELKPDLIIYDIAINTENGSDIVPLLKSPGLLPRILILTDADDETTIRSLLEAGADGFVLKSEAFCGLDHAISAVLQGHRFLSSRLSDIIVESYLHGNATSRVSQLGPFSVLTSQERNVLRLFCLEKPPKAIAADLGISRKTVDIHKRNIKRKLDIQTDIGLVKMALNSGIFVGKTEPMAELCRTSPD